MKTIDSNKGFSFTLQIIVSVFLSWHHVLARSPASIPKIQDMGSGFLYKTLNPVVGLRDSLGY